MSNLRSALVRLAHEKPELRAHLLPLIQKQGNIGKSLRGLVKNLNDSKGALQKEMATSGLRLKDAFAKAYPDLNPVDIMVSVGQHKDGNIIGSIKWHQPHEEGPSYDDFKQWVKSVGGSLPSMTVRDKHSPAFDFLLAR